MRHTDGLFSLRLAVVGGEKDEQTVRIVYTDGACSNNGKANAIAGIGSLHLFLLHYGLIHASAHWYMVNRTFFGNPPVPTDLVVQGSGGAQATHGTSRSLLFALFPTSQANGGWFTYFAPLHRPEHAF